MSNLLSFLDPGYSIPLSRLPMSHYPGCRELPSQDKDSKRKQKEEGTFCMRKTWQTYLYNRKTCWSWARKFLWAPYLKYLLFLPSLLLSFLDLRKGLQLCDSKHSPALGIVLLNRLRQSCSVWWPTFPHYHLIAYPSVIALLRLPN